MKIEVAVNNNDTTKKRGDLLEELAKKLLEAQNYDVKSELRETGVELDLYCTNKANRNKTIYVECKAFRNKKIDANIIDNLIGKKTRKKYSEAWLISTTEFGKEAKGIQKELEDEKNTEFTFYTPEKLLEALKDSNTICSIDIVKDKLKEKNKLGNETLLISKYGYFWIVEYLEGGKPSGVFVAYAKDGNLVDDEELLENLSKTDTSLNQYDFKKNLEIVGGKIKNLYLHIVKNLILN